MYELQDRRRAIAFALAALVFGLNIPSDLAWVPWLGLVELVSFVVLLLAAVYFALSTMIWRDARRMEEE